MCYRNILLPTTVAHSSCDATKQQEYCNFLAVFYIYIKNLNVKLLNLKIFIIWSNLRCLFKKYKSTFIRIEFSVGKMYKILTSRSEYKSCRQTVGSSGTLG